MHPLTRAACAALAIAIPVAGASAQTISSITANFENALPAGAATINNSDPSNILVCWRADSSPDCAALGAPGLSGYGFAPSGTPLNPGFSPFALGTFTHYNFPISLDAPGPLTSVELLFSFSIGGATPSVFSDSWTLSHEETENEAPCSYAGGDPCADRVTFALTSSGGATPFEYLGTNYTIQLFGFGATAEDAVLNPAFITLEGQANSTQLWAQITEVPPTSTVPEPATMTLLATGLAGMAAARRKRRSNG